MDRVAAHNQEIRSKAEYRAREMRYFPSPLEEKMQKILDENFVNYDFQKIFYIYADDGWIIRYYIADFYIPDRKVIIEVDGKKYHEHHSQKDKERTRNIQENYPEVEVLRYSWKDLSDLGKMEEMLWQIS